MRSKPRRVFALTVTIPRGFVAADATSTEDY